MSHLYYKGLLDSILSHAILTPMIVSLLLLLYYTQYLHTGILIQYKNTVINRGPVSCSIKTRLTIYN
jgi:hypothetical protein